MRISSLTCFIGLLAFLSGWLSSSLERMLELGLRYSISGERVGGEFTDPLEMGCTVRMRSGRSARSAAEMEMRGLDLEARREP